MQMHITFCLVFLCKTIYMIVRVLVIVSIFTQHFFFLFSKFDVAFYNIVLADKTSEFIRQAILEYLSDKYQQPINKQNKNNVFIKITAITLTNVVFPEYCNPTKVSSISSFQNKLLNQSNILLIIANMFYGLNLNYFLK